MLFDRLYKDLTSFAHQKPSLQDALNFLAYSVYDDVPVYLAGDSDVFLYGVLTPLDRLVNDFQIDLIKWNLRIPSGWSYSYSADKSNEEYNISLESPLSETGSRILDESEPIFFWRDFEDIKSYLEVNQKISHILQIHLHGEKDEQRKLYQRINNNGDLENISIAYQDGKFRICTLQRQAIEIAALITKTTLVRVFEIHFSTQSLPCEDDCQGIKTLETDFGDQIYYVIGLVPFKGCAYIRGFQKLNFEAGREKIAQLVCGDVPRQYVDFLVLDWKNQQLKDLTCNPNLLGNYFFESDLPFEISPVFFRGEVLLKYKQNPDKYKIQARQIYCRATWSLRYDVNEYGQVHVYLKDLAGLPYNEQLYWKSFNEPPVSGISARSFAQDFEGSWATFEDPLASLKSILSYFPPVKIKSRVEELYIVHSDSLDRLSYIHAGSRKEWEDQILNLAKITVDGLQKSTVKKIAKFLQCESPNLGSIKLFSHCLSVYGVDEQIVNDFSSLFGEIWATRNQIAHPAKTIDLDYQDHFSDLLSRSSEVMETLSEIINYGFPERS